ncbi:hypothetical protein FEM54_21030, partial [Pseudomonas edaphica]
LRVGMPPGTLRVPPGSTRLKTSARVTRSVTGCMPTRSVGTIISSNPRPAATFRLPHRAPCGSWLACDGGGSAMKLWADSLLSQASQLPHVFGDAS